MKSNKYSIMNQSFDTYSASGKRYSRPSLFKRCGRSGILLPRISLGFWHNFGEADLYSRCRETALYAFDNGIVHFDLANNYGPPPGSAEQTLKRLLEEDLGPYRDELFISSKAGYEMWEGPYGNWGSRKSLMASIDQSLKRTGLDYFDLFYSHRYDPETPLEETLQALADIVRSGKALYIGLSRWPEEACSTAFRYLEERDVPCLIYQGRLNILDREVIRKKILDKVHDNGCGFIAFSPLAQGLLSDRYLNGIPRDSRMAREHFLKSSVLTEELLKKLELLQELAFQRGESLATMSLAWILQHKEVTSVLTGASSARQLAQNLACLDSAPFSRDEMEAIDLIVK